MFRIDLAFWAVYLCSYLVGADPQFNIDVSRAQDLNEFGQKIKGEFERNYGWMKEYLTTMKDVGNSYKEPAQINVVFDPNYAGVAVAGVDTITCGANYYRVHQDDVGSLIHELVNIIQQYQSDNVPAWLKEGIAAYVVNFKYAPGTARKPTGGSYEEDEQKSAYLLDYSVKKTQERGQYLEDDWVQYLNWFAREGQYDQAIWETYTQDTPQGWWDKMMAADAKAVKPQKKPAVWPKINH